MLSVEAVLRPRATGLLLMYKAYCHFYEQFYFQAASNAVSDFMTYNEWSEIGALLPSIEEVAPRIGRAIMGELSPFELYQLWKELVYARPSCVPFHKRLSRISRDVGGQGFGIEIYKELAIRFPQVSEVWDQLLDIVCESQIDRGLAINVWRNLELEMPERPEPLARLAEFHSRQGNLHGEFHIRKELAYKFAKLENVMRELATSSLWRWENRWAWTEDEVIVWKELAAAFPLWEPVFARFSEACKRRGSEITEIQLLVELLLKIGPSNMLCQYLTRAFKRIRRIEVPTAWQLLCQLILEYPNHYHDILYDFCESHLQPLDRMCLGSELDEMIENRKMDLRQSAMIHKAEGNTSAEKAVWERYHQYFDLTIWVGRCSAVTESIEVEDMEEGN